MLCQEVNGTVIFTIGKKCFLFGSRHLVPLLCHVFASLSVHFRLVQFIDSYDPPLKGLQEDLNFVSPRIGEVILLPYLVDSNIKLSTFSINMFLMYNKSNLCLKLLHELLDIFAEIIKPIANVNQTLSYSSSGQRKNAD